MSGRNVRCFGGNWSAPAEWCLAKDVRRVAGRAAMELKRTGGRARGEPVAGILGVRQGQVA
ncbi:hypothetical protein BS78_01G056800 [Paspalum vaginatum]|nr:hypothetical protein BS78_01G056800 [Paspalum vaginatum]